MSTSSMSWPQWQGTVQPGVGGLPVVNPTPSVMNPALSIQYTPEQWQQMQQQNWQQWAQWQQQYQQWHQQYGAEYQKTLNAIATGSTNVAGLPNTSAPPPLPQEPKPPLPPEEPPLAPTTQSRQSYTNTQSYKPPVSNSNSSFLTTPSSNSGNNSINSNNSKNPAWRAPTTNVTKPPPLNTNMSKPPPNFNANNTYNAQPKTSLGKRQNVTQEDTSQDAKRNKFEQNWQQSQPPKPNAPPSQEEPTESEKKFMKQFAEWEELFYKWKDQNKDHPDKAQYKEYEKRWDTWRNQLLERREQMRRRRLGLINSNDMPKQSSKPPIQPLSMLVKPAESNNEAAKKELGDNLFPQAIKDSFLNLSSSGGIPGLDLVDTDKKTNDVPEMKMDESSIIQKLEVPDLEAISKNINNILGDQKLLSMLSLVTQNKNLNFGGGSAMGNSNTAVETATKPEITDNLSNSSVSQDDSRSHREAWTNSDNFSDNAVNPNDDNFAKRFDNVDQQRNNNNKNNNNKSFELQQQDNSRSYSTGGGNFSNSEFPSQPGDFKHQNQFSRENFNQFNESRMQHFNRAGMDDERKSASNIEQADNLSTGPNNSNRFPPQDYHDGFAERRDWRMGGGEFFPNREEKGSVVEDNFTDEMFNIDKVIDYDHKSKKTNVFEISVEPLRLFDYRHKNVNRIPLPDRPKWLLEKFKNWTAFEPSINRQPQLAGFRRFPAMEYRSNTNYPRDEYAPFNRRSYPDDFEERRYYDERKRGFDRRNDFDDARRGGEPIVEEKQECIPATSSVTCTIDDLLNTPGRYKRPPRIVIILRGPPGSGKTFLAKLIKDKEVEHGNSAPRILSLDDYFMVEQEKEVTEDGKRIKIKEMVYEYEECMEASYRASLLKSFKKTITDGYFPFIIVDNVNDKVKHFSEMWSFAKQNGFQVYVCQLELDVQICTKRNTHGRSEQDIEHIVAGWEPTPQHFINLNATNLIQAGSIPEVEMEEINSPNDNFDDGDDEENENEEQACISSKWDNFECSIDNLAKLDGTSKPLRAAGTMEDYLQLDEWSAKPSSKPGQKRVRWADLEERKQQEKIRAIGFVVGQTDWERMMDPTQGGSALTKTKYIERARNY